MLNDKDGIAVVAQGLQRVNQALVIALMQTDRRLVEDVEDVDQAGADLCGQPDALAFAALQ